MTVPDPAQAGRNWRNTHTTPTHSLGNSHPSKPPVLVWDCWQLAAVVRATRNAPDLTVTELSRASRSHDEVPVGSPGTRAVLSACCAPSSPVRASPQAAAVSLVRGLTPRTPVRVEVRAKTWPPVRVAPSSPVTVRYQQSGSTASPREVLKSDFY